MLYFSSKIGFWHGFHGLHGSNNWVSLDPVKSGLRDEIKGLALHDELLLNQLEELAGRLAIAIRYEPVNAEETSISGGLCRLKGKYVLIIHSQTTVKEKIRILIEALRQFPLNDVYVKPVIRELLEGSGDSDID